MKRTSALIFALLFCLLMPLSVFADDIYIIEDGEDDFIAAVETTTVAETETTTEANDENVLGIDTDSIGGYINEIADKLGGSVGSVLEGLDGFDFDFGNDDSEQADTTVSTTVSGIQAAEYTQANQASSMTTYPNADNNGQQVQETEGETTTQASVQEELPSVLIINNASDNSSSVSGSTLTILVFVAAVVILVLVVIIVLIVMTRKTEFNSAVKSKSTLPTVERPSALAQFIEDDIPDDGKDYSDIAYWNK